MIRSRAFWIGLFGSAAFLGIFFFAIVDDFDEVADVFASANYIYAIPSLAFYTLALWFRTVRWRYLLKPFTGASTRRALFPVVVVGYMANNLIPLRIGELMRAYYLSLRESVGTMAGFGTVALERASDVIALLLLVAIAAVVGAIGFQTTVSGVAEQIPGGVVVLTIGALLPFVAVFAVVAYVVVMSPESIRRLMGRVLFMLSPRVRIKIIDLAMNLIEGLTVIRTWKGLLKVIAFSLPVWIAEITMYYVIALGFDIRLEFGGQMEFIAAIVAFGAAANLAGILPSSAGSLGPFELLGAAALTTLGIDGDVAAAYALTVHVVLWAPVTLAGAITLFFDKTSFINLARGARNVKGGKQSQTSGSSKGSQSRAEMKP